MKTLRRASYGVLEKVGIVNISVKNNREDSKDSDITKQNSRGDSARANDELYSRIRIAGFKYLFFSILKYFYAKCHVFLR